ncbi:ACHA2-like protein [Mya arenaria]|uniref:ACHA2-like protein n=1 Tax=Mya arenaria TaxID=6604 RepID=A0ABY7DEN2_MYAAR|nr:ACHA2-like protein [Mya arenaria]
MSAQAQCPPRPNVRPDPMFAQAQVADGAYSAAMETEIRNQTVYSSGYDPISRPAEVTHVKIGLNVLAIDELDIKGQKLSVAGWLTLEWQDDRLQWNKTEKNDIEYMFTKPNDIWKPELIVDNSLANIGVISAPDLNLRVKFSGLVEWEPPRLLQTHCEVDITYYPYDEQKCAIEIVSWGFRIDELSLDHLFEEVNLEDFVCVPGRFMVMAAFGVFLTVLILLIHHRPGNPGSSCVLVKITRICARVLCMEFPRGDEQEDAQSNMVSPLKDTKEANGGSRVNITQTRETSQISSIDVEVTWVRMAEILDRTIFILFLTLTLLINIIFVAVLAYSSG